MPDSQWFRPPSDPRASVAARMQSREQAAGQADKPVEPIRPDDTAPLPAAAVAGMVVPKEKKPQEPRYLQWGKHPLLIAVPAGFGMMLAVGFLTGLIYLPAQVLVITGSISWLVYTCLIWFYLRRAATEHRRNQPDADKLEVVVERKWDTPDDIVDRFRTKLAPRRRTDNNGREIVEQDDIIECITRKHKIVLLKRLVPPCVIAAFSLFWLLAFAVMGLFFVSVPPLLWSVVWRFCVILLLLAVFMIRLRITAWESTVFAVTKFKIFVTTMPPAWAWCFINSSDQPFVRSVIKSIDLEEKTTDKALKYGTFRIATLLQQEEEKKIQRVKYIPHAEEVHAVLQSRLV